ncbi:hypothetical protein INR49_028235 [Caranx melampygus]|nr:hypothetical protein INR49_028235 [Caranx melampygus]
MDLWFYFERLLPEFLFLFVLCVWLLTFPQRLLPSPARGAEADCTHLLPINISRPIRQLQTSASVPEYYRLNAVCLPPCLTPAHRSALSRTF